MKRSDEERARQLLVSCLTSQHSHFQAAPDGVESPLVEHIEAFSYAPDHPDVLEPISERMAWLSARLAAFLHLRPRLSRPPARSRFNPLFHERLYRSSGKASAPREP